LGILLHLKAEVNAAQQLDGLLHVDMFLGFDAGECRDFVAIDRIRLPVIEHRKLV
jgi:hypothetical protein